MMRILVKSDDVRRGRKAKVHHGRHRRQWVKKIARIELSFKIELVYACETIFFKSRNRKCPSFSLLRILITLLHQTFAPKLWQSEKTVAIS